MEPPPECSPFRLSRFGEMIENSVSCAGVLLLFVVGQVTTESFIFIEYFRQGIFEVPLRVMGADVVDDGSTDSTRAIANRIAAADPGIIAVSNAGRHGFGMAISRTQPERPLR